MPIAPEQAAYSYTLQELVAILVRWRKPMFATFFAILIPAALVALLMPPLYEASATVLLSRKTSAPEFSVKSSSAPELASVLRTLERKEEINAKIEVLRSRATVEPVVDDLHLDEAAIDRIRDVRRYVRAVYKWVRRTLRMVYDETKYALHLSARPTPKELAFVEREELIDNVLNRIRVVSLPDSTVIEATFRSSDPLLAQKVINLVCDRFVAHDAGRRDARARGYFDEASQKRSAELREAEMRLEQAKEDASAYSIDEQRRFLLNSLGETSNRMKNIAASRARLAARVSILGTQLSAEPERIVARQEMNRDPALDDLRREVVGLEMRRSTAIQEFLAEAAPVQDLDARLLEARRLEATLTNPLEGSVTTELNPVRQQLRQLLLADQAELTAVLAEEGALGDQVRDFQEQLVKLGRADLKLQDMGREVRTKEEAYTLSVRNRQQAQLSEDMAAASLADVRIVDYASLPLWPIRPRRWLYLGIALAAALLGALVAPFFAEYNTATFTSEEDVRGHVGSLVVAAFPPRLQGRTQI